MAAKADADEEEGGAAANTVDQSDGGWATLRALLPWLWPEGRTDLKIRVVLALFFLLIAKVFALTAPFLYKGAVDGMGIEAGDLEALIVVPVALIVAYGLSRIATSLFSEGRDGIFAKVGTFAQRKIAVSTFRHLHDLSLAFHLDRRTGGLARAIDRGIKGIDFLLRFSLFNIVPTLIEIIAVSLIFWLKFDWRFSAITLVTVGAYILFTFRITQWRVTIRRIMNDRDTDANSRAVDSLINFETVKYFGNEELETGRYDQSMQGYERASIRAQTSLAMLNLGQVVVTSSGLIALMWLAATGVAAGKYTLGDFVLVNAFLIQLYQPLGFLGTVYREIKQALIDMEMLFSLGRIEQKVQDPPNARELTLSAAPTVKFDNVHFSYGDGRGILNGLSFEAKAGHTVAIVGPSGAGKSTVSRLLFRFYDAGSGSITVDGVDVRDVTQESLRAALGIVPQDTVLFNESIYYNVLYGKPDADEAAVRRAVEQAQLDGLMSRLPKGLETEVGERGLKLSGGERQRMAIARTLLKDPKILVLDEATSALDTATEREIQAALARASAGRTTLMIAHRLSTVVEADEIIVLDQGQVRERGTHQGLLAENGLYAEMWQAQQSKEDEKTVQDAALQ